MRFQIGRDLTTARHELFPAGDPSQVGKGASAIRTAPF